MSPTASGSSSAEGCANRKSLPGWCAGSPPTGSWRRNWEQLRPFLELPPDLRKLVYTTNAIESLNFQLRKVLRPKGHFPTEDSVLKVLYLAIQRAKMKWKRSPEWSRARAHFAIVFGDRLPA